MPELHPTANYSSEQPTFKSWNSRGKHYFRIEVVLHEWRHSARRKQLSHLKFLKNLKFSLEMKTAIMSAGGWQVAGTLQRPETYVQSTATPPPRSRRKSTQKEQYLGVERSRFQKLKGPSSFFLSSATVNLTQLQSRREAFREHRAFRRTTVSDPLTPLAKILIWKSCTLFHFVNVANPIEGLTMPFRQSARDRPKPKT